MVNALGTLLAVGSNHSGAQDALNRAAQSAQNVVQASSLHDLLHLPSHWPDLQELADWCQHMNAATGAILVIGGLIFLAFGVYLFKALTALNLTVAGAIVGALIGEKAGGATIAGGIIGGFTAAALTFPLMRWAVALIGGLLGFLAGAGLWRSMGLDPQFFWAGGLSGLIFFSMLSFILYQPSIMIYTSLQGTVMLVLGLLGLLYKYQSIAPQVTSVVTGRPFLMPATVFIATVLGMIYQQAQYGGAAAPAPKK